MVNGYPSNRMEYREPQIELYRSAFPFVVEQGSSMVFAICVPEISEHARILGRCDLKTPSPYPAA